MPASSDTATLALVVAGALAAGFTTGFAGFGTGLVASGVWFHALPAPLVPPLIALTSVAAQLVGVRAVRRALRWDRLRVFLTGGALGVPIGVIALARASPDLLRAGVGWFLMGYAMLEIFGRASVPSGEARTHRLDGWVGLAGGFLGGFAGLSGPLPILWLRLRGGSSGAQRAIYQPFNLAILAMAAAAMGLGGQIGWDVARLLLISLPATIGGAWIGGRVYLGVSERTFRCVVLSLLLASGLGLIVQGDIP